MCTLPDSCAAANSVVNERAKVICVDFNRQQASALEGQQAWPQECDNDAACHFPVIFEKRIVAFMARRFRTSSLTLRQDHSAVVSAFIARRLEATQLEKI
jgi:hypothetical protein